MHPDYLKNEKGERDTSGYNPNVLIHRLYGAVNIDGKDYRVKTTVKENLESNTNKAYSYDVAEIELLDGQTGTPEANHRKSNNSITTANLLKNVEKSYDPGKKLLDVSAELDKKDNNSEVSDNQPSLSISPEADRDYMAAVERGDEYH